MGSRMKEDDRHEIILRKLVKNGENKKCINCGSLGPQYACTSFATFVCTLCSGVHREFSHRVKSISLAKFTAGEVQALQEGGNERARDLYFKDWDPARNPLPDNSDPDKLRNFIKDVYVERRYTGERLPPTKGRQAGRENGFDSWRSESWVDQKADARRPYGDSTNDRQNNERARKSDVERSQFDLKLSPLGNEQDHQPGRRSYDEREGRREERVVNEGVRGHWRRPDNSSQSSFPPPIRSGKASLGEDSPSLRVEQPHSNGGSQTSGLHLTSPAGFRKDGRSHSLGFLGNAEVPAVAAPQLKRVSSASLIDFSAEAEPVAVTKPVSDPFGPTSVIDPFAPVGTTKPVSDPFSAGVHGGTVQSSSTGWATFDVADSPAPPKGYPDVFVASSARNFSNGPKQSGGNTWHGSSSGAVGDTWAVFGVPPAVPAPAPPPIPEPSLFAILSAPQPSTQNVPQLPSSLTETFNLVSSGSARVQREIPQDFFAPAYLESSMQNMEGRPRPSRTQNPFDDDSPPAPFNLASLHAALPPNGMMMMPFHQKGTQQWGQPMPQYPPTAIQGGFGFGNRSTSTVLPSGGASGFSTGAAVYGGGLQLFSQTTGSNPFH
ncbi:unnamed protein product [Sphagnum compactum]